MVVYDVALCAFGALARAGVLAPEGRAAEEVRRTVGVCLALVAAALKGPASEAR